MAAGLLVILHTGTPFDSGATSYTTARLDAYTAAQAWCREYARAKRDVILFDMFALLTDSATATGDFKSSYPVADKVHISPYGHQRLASSATPPSQSLVGILNTLYPSAKRYGVYNRRDDRNAASAATNYAYNPLLRGQVAPCSGQRAATYLLPGLALTAAGRQWRLAWPRVPMGSEMMRSRRWGDPARAPSTSSERMFSRS